MQAGAFFGALLAYPIADKYGRKPGLLGAAVLAGLGGVMQAASSGHLEAMYVGRTIEGLGLGAATMLTPTYLAENSPRAIRGMLTAMYQFLEVIGSMVAFWINYVSFESTPAFRNRSAADKEPPGLQTPHHWQRAMASSPRDAELAPLPLVRQHDLSQRKSALVSPHRPLGAKRSCLVQGQEPA